MIQSIQTRFLIRIDKSYYRDQKDDPLDEGERLEYQIFCFHLQENNLYLPFEWVLTIIFCNYIKQDS